MAQGLIQPIDSQPRLGQALYQRDGLLCAALMAICLLIAYPFAEIGFVDDWSYIKVAQDFVQTGHLVYRGWASPTLGWQVMFLIGGIPSGHHNL